MTGWTVMYVGAGLPVEVPVWWERPVVGSVEVVSSPRGRR